MRLNSLWSRFDIWDKSDSQLNKQDEKRLDAVLHYPLKAASIPIVSLETLISRQQDKIRIIERDIGLIYKGCEFNFVDLVESTIKAYLGYCHLIPASEMDHHQYIGGLLEHSLDVSIRSLQFAMSFMLDEMGLIDEDQARRPRYEFAAWVCGLLHDSGKIISNVQVIGSNGDIWRPLSETIFEWAKRNKIDSYTVVHQKDRLNNDHETNSVHFLPLVLNDVAKNYLLGSHDDLYSMITQTLVHYHSYKGYLFNAVRKADSESTYDDYARVWLHDSSRKKSLTMGVVNAMRSLYSSWQINKVGGDIFVFNNQIYIASDKPINDVIKKCLDYEIKLPNSAKALISILLDKRILSMVSDKSTHANLYLGNFTEADIEEFTLNKTGAMAKITPITVILVEWPNFVIGDNPIPGNVYGALRYNTKKNNNVHQLYNANGATFVIPAQNQTLPATTDTTEATVISSASATATATESYTTPEIVETQDKATTTAAQSKTKVTTPKKISVTKPIVQQAEQSMAQQVSITESESSTSKTPKSPNKALSKPKTTKTTKTKLDKTKQEPEIKTDVTVTEEPLEENSNYPWIKSKRRPKPIDDALSKLIGTSEDIWLSPEGVAVRLDFLTEKSNQNAGQIMNAMSFLKLMKNNSKNQQISTLIKDNDKIMYVLLADDVAEIFSTNLSNRSPLPKIKPSNEDKALATQAAGDSTVGSAKGNIKEQPITPSTTEEDSLQTCDDKNDEYTSEPKAMLYETLIAELKSACPHLKNTEIRSFTKSEGVTPIVSEDGSITINITSVELDELKWKLRDNNE